MAAKVSPTVNTTNTSQTSNKTFSSTCLKLVVVLGLLHGVRYVLLVCTQRRLEALVCARDF